LIILKEGFGFCIPALLPAFERFKKIKNGTIRLLMDSEIYEEKALADRS